VKRRARNRYDIPYDRPIAGTSRTALPGFLNEELSRIRDFSPPLGVRNDMLKTTMADPGHFKQPKGDALLSEDRLVKRGTRPWRLPPANQDSPLSIEPNSKSPRSPAPPHPHIYQLLARAYIRSPHRSTTGAHRHSWRRTLPGQNSP